MKEYIKVRITTRQPSSIASLQRGRSQFVIKRVPYAKSYKVISILSTNIQSLSNKVDELNEVATLNKSDITCITESWLSQLVPDTAVTLPGYLFLRNERKNNSGGGVCVYVKNRIPCKRLSEMEQTEVESLWIQLRPHSLPRNIPIILLAVIYHST